MDDTAQPTFRKIFEEGNKARKEKKELKIQIVESLLLKGIKTTAEIHKVLKNSTPPMYVPERSIARYKSIINKRNEEEVRKKGNLSKTVQEVAFEIKRNFELVTKEAWQTYHAPGTGARTKAALLAMVRDTCEKNVKLLQSLGLVYEKPEQHQYLDKDGNPTDAPDVNVMALNQQFTAFIKANYQLPLGVNEKEEQSNA